MARVLTSVGGLLKIAGVLEECRPPAPVAADVARVGLDSNYFTSKSLVWVEPPIVTVN
jgi:hypothetical protein